MGCHRVMGSISGLMDQFIKETLNKVIEMDTGCGNLQIKNKGIKVTTYLIKSMAMEFMNI